MKSYTTLTNLFTTFVQNTSTNVTALGQQLINDAQRYLLQKYYNNESLYSIPTAGGTTHTLTGAVSAGATSATLSSAWTGNTVNIQVTFSGGDLRLTQFTNNSTAINWDVPLTANSTATISVGGQQFYPTPPNYSKLKNITVTVGNLQWPVQEILTKREWDTMNVFPYYADIPVYFYVYPGGDHGAMIGIWPIPSTTNNVINISYKYRVPDLSIADTTGTASVSNGGLIVTSSGLVPTTNAQLESRWIQFAQPDGDNLWYQINSISSATTANLYAPYQGNSITNKAYTIGQMPLINEDFHDLLVYWAVVRYFSTIQFDPQKAASFKSLLTEGEEKLAEYCGTNTIDVNLGRRPLQKNPNLFGQSFG